MPFQSHLMSKHTITWLYMNTDIVEPRFGKNIQTLIIIGPDEHNIYPTTTMTRICPSYYDEELFVKNAHEIKNLPLISIDLQKIFPNVRHISLIQLNIDLLTIPTMLIGFTARDTQIQHINLQHMHMQYVTLNSCYGLWNALCIPYVKTLTVLGDYHDNFIVCNNAISVRISASKIGRINILKYIIHLETFIFTECVFPYPDYTVNKRYNIQDNPTSSVWEGDDASWRAGAINSLVYYDRMSINSRISIIRKINQRIDDEQNTNGLVLLLNGSFNSDISIQHPLYDGNIRKVMALGSNYPRRIMEFISSSTIV